MLLVHRFVIQSEAEVSVVCRAHEKCIHLVELWVSAELLKALQRVLRMARVAYLLIDLYDTRK